MRTAALSFCAPRHQEILPHLADRTLTLGRFPEGVHRAGFAQTELPGRPSWVRAEKLALANGKVKAFVVAEEEATLAWLAQMGTIELHVFLGRAGALEVPVSWDELAAAREPRDFAPADVLARVGRIGDPFAPVLETRQTL